MDVKTGQNGVLLSNRHRKKTPSCNRFLSSSVCMSDLAWRRTEQAHRPIGSVVRTSASTNQKRRANKRLDQSEASGKQAHRPIRTVGRTSASTNQKSFTKQRRRRSINKISSVREHWRTPRHARMTDFLRTNFLSSYSSPSQNHGSANHESARA